MPPGPYKLCNSITNHDPLCNTVCVCVCDVMWPVSYMYALSLFVFILRKVAIYDSIGVQDIFPSKDNKAYLNLSYLIKVPSYIIFLKLIYTRFQRLSTRYKTSSTLSL